jgi:hydrogenase nickel incorporation protein HypB
MCENCGCAVTAGQIDRHPHPAPLAPAHRRVQSVTVLQDILSENDRIASHNRKHIDAHRVLAVNLMSSPGAGKTALLERTIDALQGELRIAVIEGDLATENDARRIRSRGVPAVQIVTGTACHLDARMVHDALHDLVLEDIDLLFIENVGNLVCPASFDLGQHLDVTLLSAPEGDDKPEKYPVMFRAADLLLISKSDLLPLMPEFDPEHAEESLRAVGSDAPVIRLSSRTGSGIEAWCAWLKAHLGGRRAHVRRDDTRTPKNERAAALDPFAV